MLYNASKQKSINNAIPPNKFTCVPPHTLTHIRAHNAHTSTHTIKHASNYTSQKRCVLRGNRQQKKRLARIVRDKTV